MKDTKHANFINGEWVDGQTYSTNTSPSDLDDVIGLYARGSVQECEQALTAAKEASSVWAESALEERKRVLDMIGAELIERSAEIGTILAREEGKTIAEGTGEVYLSLIHI